MNRLANLENQFIGISDTIIPPQARGLIIPNPDVREIALEPRTPTGGAHGIDHHGHLFHCQNLPEPPLDDELHPINWTGTMCCALALARLLAEGTIDRQRVRLDRKYRPPKDDTDQFTAAFLYHLFLRDQEYFYQLLLDNHLVADLLLKEHWLIDVDNPPDINFELLRDSPWQATLFEKSGDVPLLLWELGWEYYKTRQLRQGGKFIIQETLQTILQKKFRFPREQGLVVVMVHNLGVVRGRTDVRLMFSSVGGWKNHWWQLTNGSIQAQKTMAKIIIYLESQGWKISNSRNAYALARPKECLSQRGCHTGDERQMIIQELIEKIANFGYRFKKGV